MTDHPPRGRELEVSRPAVGRASKRSHCPLADAAGPHRVANFVEDLDRQGVHVGVLFDLAQRFLELLGGGDAAAQMPPTVARNLRWASAPETSTVWVGR